MNEREFLDGVMQDERERGSLLMLLLAVGFSAGIMGFLAGLITGLVMS